jgi:hypothetical protein
VGIQFAAYSGYALSLDLPEWEANEQSLAPQCLWEMRTIAPDTALTITLLAALPDGAGQRPFDVCGSHGFAPRDSIQSLEVISGAPPVSDRGRTQKIYTTL